MKLCALCAACLLFASCLSHPAQDSAEVVLATLTLEEKVAQLFIIAPEQLVAQTPDVPCTRVTTDMKKVLALYPVGGFCFFAQNIKNEKQLKKITADLKKVCKLVPILAVDEEGGRVARLARAHALGLTNVGTMEAIGATGNTALAQRAGAYIGTYLRDYGFTLDFAPVADINTNPQNRVIGDRAFGNTPQLVSDMAGAFLHGLHSAGIAGCIKHFPGHGDTQQDTHAEYVAVDKSWEELQDCELIPFIAQSAVADCMMIAHLSLPQITHDGSPASLSKEFIATKVRGELAYNGVVLTDALNMGAIQTHYGAAEAAVRACEAGNDIVLLPADFIVAYNAVLSAVKEGRISVEQLDTSVIRILRLKGY